MSGGQHYIKFYGSDWRSDMGLRLCAAATRGVWIDCITLMMDAVPYGHLAINGKPMSAAQISAVTATPQAIVVKALDELIENGVCSISEDGIIYSRRMIRDQERAETDRANGGRGGRPKNPPVSKNETPRFSESKPPGSKKPNPGVSDFENPPESRYQIPEDSSLRSESKPPPTPPNGIEEITEQKSSRKQRDANAGKRTLPDDFEPDLESLRECQKLGIDPDIILPEFRDWAKSKQPKYADWQATFRNSARRTAEYRAENAARRTNRPGPTDVVGAALRVGEARRRANLP